MKYIIIEKRVEQVWNDKETFIMRQELEYVPCEGYNTKAVKDYIEAYIIEDIITMMIEDSIDNLKAKYGYDNHKIERTNFEVDKCLNTKTFVPYMYDKTNNEYEEIYYIRVTEREVKTVSEMEEA